MAERPQRGLGRGLSALLGEAAEAPQAPAARTRAVEGPPTSLPIEVLERNPNQPRRTFDEEALAELTASIREKGVLQPLLVRPLAGGRYQIVAGERRWRAAQAAGVAEAPVVVRELDDREVLEVGIIENVQRADLDVVEEAFAYRALMTDFGRTQESVAQIVGKSRSHIANSMRLLNLPEPVQQMLQRGELSAGHARALLGAADPEQMASEVVAKEMSVRETENAVRTAGLRDAMPGPRRGGGRRGAERSVDTRDLEEDLSEILGVRVEIHDRNGRGELRLTYDSLEQLDDLCGRLTRPAG